MTFSTTRQPDPEDRLPRGLGRKTLMLEAIREATGGDELDFFKQVILIGLGKDGGEAGPVPMLLSEAMKRIQPPLKPNGEKIRLNIPADSNHAEKCEIIFQACADGDISPEQGQMFIGMIKDCIAVTESTELIERLERIEEALKNK